MNVRLATFCVLGMALSLAGCGPANDATERPESARAFPEPDRPVSEVGSNQFSTEDKRDSQGEAQKVMDLASIEPGMTIADIGAGEGYAAIREKYIDPIEQAYALCLRISTAIANEFGAHG